MQEKNPEGCTKCFCFGQTTRCENAYLRPFDVSMMKNLTLHTINIKGGKLNKTDWFVDESILVNDTTGQVILGDVDNPECKIVDSFVIVNYILTKNFSNFSARWIFVLWNVGLFHQPK